MARPTWSQASATLDATVDRHLCDEIYIAADGVTFSQQPGFVILGEAGLGMGAIDENFSSRNRLKIAKTILPVITSTHRFKAAELGIDVVWKSGGGEPQEQGRYLIFDIQKA